MTGRAAIAGAIAVALGAGAGAARADESVWDKATVDVETEAARFTYSRQLEAGNEDVQLAASDIDPRTKRRHVAHALTAYRNAITAMPDEAEAHYRLGITEYTFYLFCPERATLMCDPDSPDPAIMRDVADHWHRFTELAPLDTRGTDLLFQRALLHTKLATRSDFELAIADYEAILDHVDGSNINLDPDGVLSNLAETYMMVDKLDEAIATYERALELGGDTQTMYGLAVALDRDGQGTRARQLISRQELHAFEYFQARVQSGETFYVPDGEVNYYLALAEEALGFTQQAIVHWDLFVRSGAHPQFQPRAKHNRDALAAKLGRTKK